MRKCGLQKIMNIDHLNEIKKEIVASMKIMDATIKGVKESDEYKMAQAYNQGLRDAMNIFERKIKVRENKMEAIDIETDTISKIYPQKKCMNIIEFKEWKIEHGLFTNQCQRLV